MHIGTYIEVLQQVDFRLEAERKLGMEAQNANDAHHDLPELALRYIAQLYFLHCDRLSGRPIERAFDAEHESVRERHDDGPHATYGRPAQTRPFPTNRRVAARMIVIVQISSVRGGVRVRATRGRGLT